MIAEKLEITIKINELAQPKTVKNAWQQFDLDCDGRITTITVKPKNYKKLTDITSNYPQWLAAMSNDKPRSVYAGKLGQSTELGLVLKSPKMKVFERKPKAEKTPAAGAAS
ncbi:fertility inhibition FinO-like protein [Nostoc sp. KVJ3]|uniref:fertility inhibition FinO-like protein n=1 Tax=Nostoc sp. KVJ3 TaxID=457945 RepID=UPI002238EC2C|nr:fertility inhibition FinO-like protein [Nostoc sp. KVJ3]MCW5319065.1 fertility inhibition FinO-like protein [Nostoc sp. KVJ3]